MVFLQYVTVLTHSSRLFLKKSHTQVHIACQDGRVDVLEMLRHIGDADLNIQDAFGRTCLDLVRRMKDAMRNDRARIQIGSISHFGLLEMSRQRLRISFNESISNVCPHCEGTGRVRSVETAALQLLRAIEDEASKGKMDQLRITMHNDVALYILNHKRASVTALEEQFGISIVILADPNLTATEHNAERVGWQGSNQRKPAKTAKPATADVEAVDEADSAESEDRPEADEASEDDQPRRRKRGRRGGRRRRRRGGEAADNAVDADAAANDDAANDGNTASDASTEAAAPDQEDGKSSEDGKGSEDGKSGRSRRRRGRGPRTAARRRISPTRTGGLLSTTLAAAVSPTLWSILWISVRIFMPRTSTGRSRAM